jgi:hypothetical protein
MAKLMSKSELVQKIAAQHSLSRKDVKGVIETLAEVGYKEGDEKEWRLRGARLRQVRCH